MAKQVINSFARVVFHYPSGSVGAVSKRCCPARGHSLPVKLKSRGSMPGAWNGTPIARMEKRWPRAYVNATAMCKAFEEALV